MFMFRSKNLFQEQGTRVTFFVLRYRQCAKFVQGLCGKRKMTNGIFRCRQDGLSVPKIMAKRIFLVPKVKSEYKKMPKLLYVLFIMVNSWPKKSIKSKPFIDNLAEYKNFIK